MEKKKLTVGDLLSNKKVINENNKVSKLKGLLRKIIKEELSKINEEDIEEVYNPSIDSNDHMSDEEKEKMRKNAPTRAQRDKMRGRKTPKFKKKEK